MNPRAPGHGVLLLLGALAITPGAGASPLSAQQAPGNALVHGVVIDAGSRQPVTGAIVRLRRVRVAADTTGPRTFSIRTGPEGTFRFGGLRTGSYLLAALYANYASPIERIFLANNDQVEVEFAVGEPGVTLPELTVEGVREVEPSPMHRSFYERAERGLGDYLLREDLEPYSGLSLWNAIRTLPGLRVDCATGGCRVESAQANSLACPGGARVIIDGHPAPADQLGRTSPQEVEGVEVYGGASTAPLEYRGANPACGLILVWTRRGP